MVNSINNIVNRVEAQKSRDLEAKTGSGTADSKSVAPAARDTVKVSDAASPQVVAQLSQNPPIDSEAVSRIKNAIAEGRYPVDVDLISDALMDAYRDLKT
ncbi:flagellar biosynthesis anti-sigma factor FlgM [Alphaproteobacteria bacterium]|nr:flagellar biosynthesis anti-sigma factor FlgM [Alphaproteobacteria bacterium]